MSVSKPEDQALQAASCRCCRKAQSGADTESLTDNSAYISDSVSILYKEHDGFVVMLMQSYEFE